MGDAEAVADGVLRAANTRNDRRALEMAYRQTRRVAGVQPSTSVLLVTHKSIFLMASPRFSNTKKRRHEEQPGFWMPTKWPIIPNVFLSSSRLRVFVLKNQGV